MYKTEPSGACVVKFPICFVQNVLDLCISLLALNLSATTTLPRVGKFKDLSLNLLRPPWRVCEAHLHKKLISTKLTNIQGLAD